jgi:hypothetical protein
MNTAKDAISVTSTGTLAALRNLGRRPAKSMNQMRHVASRQADLLGRLLPGATRQVSTHVTNLIPTVVVEPVARLHVPGVTFWANRRWHIHVREGDSTSERAFTVLHQLKHIIDHPMRRASTTFSDADWDSLARYFACRVLARDVITVSA